MAFDKNKLVYEMDPDGPNLIIDEGSNNSFVAVRKVRWNPNGPFKIDLRRYVVRTDGEERPGKGISLTDDSADVLVESMADYGYGRTDKLLETLFEREDFNDALAAINPANAEAAVTTARDMLDSIFNGDD